MHHLRQRFFDVLLRCLSDLRKKAGMKAVKQLPIQASALAADAEQEIETVGLEKPKG